MKVYIVGAGPSGCWVARRVNEMGYDVTVITHPENRLQSERFGHYRVYYGEGLGGSARYSMGNFWFWGPEGLRRPFERVLRDMTCEVRRTPDSVISNLDIEFEEAAEDVGLEPEHMPKSVHFDLCDGCGECLECPRNAKWVPQDELPEGVSVLRDECIRFEFSGGKAAAIVLRSQTVELETDDIVVLCAGCPGTPRLLERSGIDADGPLFVDAYIHVVSDLEAEPGIQMPIIVDMDEYILSPHRTSAYEGKYSIMVKIADELSGDVISGEKPISVRETELFAEGCAVAGEIISRMGGRVRAVTEPSGAHPGGTLSDRVDNRYALEGYDNVYVVDANVLPEPLGKPPVGAILAMAEDFCDKLRRSG
ncbi:GMC family oxidoreductase N-terminal domain-containing protein [Methanopyrus sp.]